MTSYNHEYVSYTRAAERQKLVDAGHTLTDGGPLNDPEIAQHTNILGDNRIYQDAQGFVTVKTNGQPNTTCLIEYEDEGPNGAYITIDFNEQQIVDFRAVNRMYPLPNVGG